MHASNECHPLYLIDAVKMLFATLIFLAHAIVFSQLQYNIEAFSANGYTIYWFAIAGSDLCDL